MEHDILMIFGIKDNCIVGYCYKYDCFCAPGTLTSSVLIINKI